MLNKYFLLSSLSLLIVVLWKQEYIYSRIILWINNSKVQYLII